MQKSTLDKYSYLYVFVYFQNSLSWPNKKIQTGQFWSMGRMFDTLDFSCGGETGVTWENIEFGTSKA